MFGADNMQSIYSRSWLGKGASLDQRNTIQSYLFY